MAQPAHYSHSEFCVCKDCMPDLDLCLNCNYPCPPDSPDGCCSEFCSRAMEAHAVSYYMQSWPQPAKRDPQTGYAYARNGKRLVLAVQQDDDDLPF